MRGLGCMTVHEMSSRDHYCRIGNKGEMSGIAGVYVSDGSRADSDLVRVMTGAMSYRGPDGISHWANGGVALGHCMMRTTMEAMGESQPYVDPNSGAAITFAGRLDQRDALTELLRGEDRLPVQTFDSALALGAYLAFGFDCFEAINGDFAFAIWDNEQRRVILARDRMGLVPLHYYCSGPTVVFASDAHAILHLPNVPKRLNQGVVAEILSDRWDLRGETLWQGISTVRPGTYLQFDSSGATAKRYWPSLSAIPDIPDNEEFLVSAYRRTLTDALADCCRASTPVTFSVSGGLDSSALICLSAELRESGRTPDLNALACTLNYAETQGTSEIQFARMACNEAKVGLVELLPQAESAEDLVHHCEEFKALPGYLAQRKHLSLMRYAHSSGSRVFITGEGGDQLVGGQSSQWFELIRRGQWLRFLRAAARAVRSHGSRAPLSALSVASSVILPKRLHSAVRMRIHQLLTRGSKHETPLSLLTPVACRLLAKRSKRHAALDTSEGEEFRWWPCKDEFFLNMLMNFERLAATHQIEVRHPYMSARMVELASVTPKHLKEARGVEKIMHRRALEGVLPDPIRRRTDKSGCDLSVDAELELLLGGFTPATCLPISRAGLERLQNRFSLRRNKGVASVGNDNWTLQSLWFLNAIARKRC